MRALVFSIDDQYVMPFQVLFHSLHKTESLLDNPPIYVLHEKNLSVESIATLREFLRKYGQEVIFVDTTSHVPDDLPFSEKDHVSKATFYRLFVAEFLPPQITSALYVDSDTLVVRSIRELLHIELTSPVATVDHLSPYDQLRMWGWSGGGYFQAGVILIDLNYWRTNNCTKMFVDIMKTQRHRIQWWDQDILNIAFANNWQRLDIWFNVCQSAMAIVPNEVTKNNARLLHFDGSHKPWLQSVQRPYKDAWLDAYKDAFGKEFENPWPLPPPLCQRIVRAASRWISGLLFGAR
jgi:lipopolysaccharide biosynthesis glycosyltransferase